MKRLLLGIMMLVTAGAASAEWTLSNFTANYFAYTDIASIRRNGNLVKMWDLKDYKTVQTVDGYSYLSSKGQQEYDCKEVRRRTVAFTLFGGKMGNGKVVYQNSETSMQWSPIAPESKGEALWEIACGKK